MNEIIRYVVIVLGLLIGLVAIAGALTYVERRLLALWQDRHGPNRAGPFGLLQLVADILKLFFKEDWVPPFADKLIYVVAPCIIVITVMLSFAVIPITADIQVVDVNIGLLFFLGMSSLGVYAAVLGGWASNSKYALMGALRAAGQMLSYEVFMGLSLMGVVMAAGSFSLREIVQGQSGMWYCIPQVLGLIVFVIAGIAETRRLPFDLPESDAELVQGFHTEYASMKFGLFFLGEYLGVTLISAMIVTLFFGGWLGPVLPPIIWFAIKTAVFIGFFVLLRAGLPRPRYDQLMAFGWKAMLPIALVNLVITGGVLLASA